MALDEPRPVGPFCYELGFTAEVTADRAVRLLGAAASIDRLAGIDNCVEAVRDRATAGSRGKRHFNNLIPARMSTAATN